MNVRAAGLVPYLYAAAAVLLWPLIELLGARLGARHEAVQIVWIRYAVHLLMLVAYCALRGHWRTLRTSRPALQLLRGVCMFGMPFCFILAARYAALPWVWTVFWLAPALVLCASPLLREQPRTHHLLAVALGWVGVVAVLAPEPESRIGTLLALAMAATFAGYVLASRALAHEQMASSLFFTALGALLPMSWLALRAWTPLAAGDALPALSLGLASLGFLFALDRALERAPAVNIAPLMPAVVAWEALLHGGLARGAAVAGIAAILVGVLVLPLHAAKRVLA